MYKFVRNCGKLCKQPRGCVCYCSDKGNSSPVETPPPTKARLPKTRTSALSMAKTDYIPPSKSEMQWRTPWHQKEGQYFNALRAMNAEENQASILKLVQTPISFSPTVWKKWFARKTVEKDIIMQSYLPERNRMLGNELAAAHFIVHRGGAVKFFNEDKWIKANKLGDYNLPRFFESDKVLQAIDCTNVNLYYEGLLNFKELEKCEWLRLDGIEQVDDWYLDRISRLFAHSLIYLDIRNCPNYTERGLVALTKFEKLKILCIDDMLMTSPFEMTCILLQEHNPDLDIQIG